MSDTFPAAFARRGLVVPPGAFRLILAAAVVVSHLSRLDIGRLAVLVFFYLSGYWTARIWDEKFAGRQTLWFYAARYLRIAPLYLLAVAAAALALGRALHPENLALLGVATTRRDPIAVAWSLDIELQFYLILPLVMGLALRLSARWMLAAAVVVSVIGFWLQAQFGVVTAAKYAPAFVLGVVTFTGRWRPDARTANLSLTAFLAISLFTAFTPFFDKRVPDPFDRDIYGLFWLLPLLPWVARSLTIRSSRLDRHLGNLSYPLYLVHWPVIALILPHVGHGLPARLAAAGAAAALAVALYVLVGRPIDAWRVRVTEKGEGEGARPQPASPGPGDPGLAKELPVAFAAAGRQTDGAPVPATVPIGELRRTFADPPATSAHDELADADPPFAGDDDRRPRDPAALR
jgi:peptidoglycan/LPS O-acetylase OafA/YrhL